MDDMIVILGTYGLDTIAFALKDACLYRSNGNLSIVLVVLSAMNIE
jgi:hypothetical protein